MSKYKLVPVEPTQEMIGEGRTAEVEAPSHSLPNWSECNLRVGNSEWLKDNDRKPEHDSLTANPLHEFIYEYDDSDAYKSAWFLHRLEKLIGFIKSEQVPAPEVAKLAEALEEARLTLEVMQGRGSSVGLTLAIIDRALAAYRKQGGDL